MQDRTFSSPAEELYVEKCAMCHRQMGMGTVILARRMDPAEAQLEDRTNLNPQFVTMVARRGMGNMPPIPVGEISDEELAMVANYLAGRSGQ